MTSVNSPLLQSLSLRTAVNQSALVRRQIAVKTISSTVAKTSQSR
jgi:hypothetical protein